MISHGVKMKVSNKTKAKIIVFFSSLTLSLLAVEVGLRVAGFTVQRARQASLKDFKKSHDREEILTLRKDHKNKKLIVAVGDSVTNGSNVKISDSYPFQLFKMQKELGKKESFDVINHGFCEKNTFQVLGGFKNLINQIENKPNTVILMAGAADRFNPIDEYVDKDSLSEKINISTRSFIHSLRLYKIYRGIVINLEQGILNSFGTDWHEFSEVEKKFPKITEAEKAFDEENIEKGESIVKSHPKEYWGPLLSKAILNKTYDFLKTQDYEKMLDFSFNILERNPYFFLENESSLADQKYFLYKIVMAYDFQSKYDADEVIAIFEKIAKANPEVKETPLYKRYYRIFSNKEAEQKKVNDKRLAHLREFVEFSRKNNINIVVSNYPADFRMANKALRTVASEYNLPFVDNYKLFKSAMKEKGRQYYLEEDEHPTAKGYQLIASNVWKTLEKEKPSE